MSVRRFTRASSEKITLSLGATNFAFGPGTIAAVAFPTQVSALANVFSAGASATVGYSMRVSAAAKLSLVTDGNVALGPAGSEALVVNTWYLLAATKATGTVAPRLHVYNYTTKVWTHANSAATLANSSTPLTESKIGCQMSSINFWGGDIAAIGLWNVVLTDAQIESLLLFMTVAAPKGMWRLNQDTTGDTVQDLTGGGANQSAIVGTSITAVDQPVGLMNLAPPKPVPTTVTQFAVPRAGNF